MTFQISADYSFNAVICLSLFALDLEEEIRWNDGPNKHFDCDLTMHRARDVWSRKHFGLDLPNNSNVCKIFMPPFSLQNNAMEWKRPQPEFVEQLKCV